MEATTTNRSGLLEELYAAASKNIRQAEDGADVHERHVAAQTVGQLVAAIRDLEDSRSAAE